MYCSASNFCKILERDMRHIIRHTKLLQITANSNNLLFTTDKSRYQIKYSIDNKSIIIGHNDYVTDGNKCIFNTGKYISDVNVKLSLDTLISHQYKESVTYNKSDLILCSFKLQPHNDYNNITTICVTIKSYEKQYDLYLGCKPDAILQMVSNMDVHKE